MRNKLCKTRLLPFHSTEELRNPKREYAQVTISFRSRQLQTALQLWEVFRNSGLDWVETSETVSEATNPPEEQAVDHRRLRNPLFISDRFIHTPVRTAYHSAHQVQATPVPMTHNKNI
uniref:Uncharacterized protein n=1 Tax=Tetraselmis sp. GSL018 TaxID=582737 RepID=A0A061RF70_9CHLO